VSSRQSWIDEDMPYAWLLSRTRAWSNFFHNATHSALPIYYTLRQPRLCTIFAISTAFISDFPFSFSALHSKASFLCFQYSPSRSSIQDTAHHCIKRTHQIMSHTTKVTRGLDLLHKSIMADAPDHGANRMLGSTYSSSFLFSFSTGVEGYGLVRLNIQWVVPDELQWQHLHMNFPISWSTVY